MPIFSVKFAENTKVADFKRIRKVCIVNWEKIYFNKKITQCYKCQGFMDIAKNCYKPEACAYCAGYHNSKNCTNQSKIKCVNCGKSHKANSSECEIYTRVANRHNANYNNQIKSTNHHNDKMFSTDSEEISRSYKTTNHQPRSSYSQVTRGKEASYNTPILTLKSMIIQMPLAQFGMIYIYSSK